MRRGWIIGLLLLLPAGALLAFGPRRTADIPPDRVVVRYWEKWAGAEGRAIQELVDEFNRTVGADRRIHVQYVSLGSMISERLLVACAGGDPPELAGLFDYAVPQYADLGALEPLDPFIVGGVSDPDLAPQRHDDPESRSETAPTLVVRQDDFVPALWDIGVYRSRLYALPSTPFSVALYYNKGLFRQAGLDADHPPKTMAELEAFGERLTKFAADGRLERVGFLPSPKVMNWWHWFWPYFFGMTPDESGTFRIDSPAGLGALRWVANYRERFGADRTQAFEQGLGIVLEGAQNPFMAGRVAMIHQGPWMANLIQRYTPSLDFGVAAFPSDGPDGRRPVFVSSDVLVIPKGAKHPRHALVFLDWFMRQDVLERLCKAHGKNSPFKSPRDDFFREHPNSHAREHHELANSPSAFGYPKMTTWPQVTHELLTTVNNVWFGIATPEAAARDGQRRIDEIVAQYEQVASRRR